MGKATAKNLAIGNPADMGANHVKRHSKELAFLQSGDAPTETLLGNHLADVEEIYADTMNLAYQQGMLNEDEWAEWNDERADKRGRKNVHANYSEYKEYVSSKISKRMTPKEKNVQRLNDGMAFESGLYYLGSVEDYARMGLVDTDLNVLDADGLKKYRTFEGESLKDFYNSGTYQTLHKGIDSRAELHYGEDGAVHLQTVGVMGAIQQNSVKVKPYEIAPTKVKEERLREYFGDDVFEQELYREQVIQVAKKANKGFVPKRSDYEDVNMQDADKVAKKAVKGGVTHTQLVKQMWWRVHQDKMEDVALEKSKELGVEWSRDYGDGVKQPTRSKRDYVIHIKDKIKNDTERREISEGRSLLDSAYDNLEINLSKAKEKIKTKEHTNNKYADELKDKEQELARRAEALSVRTLENEREREALAEQQSLLEDEKRLGVYLNRNGDEKIEKAVQSFEVEHERKPDKQELERQLVRDSYKEQERERVRILEYEKNRAVRELKKDSYNLDPS